MEEENKSKTEHTQSSWSWTDLPKDVTANILHRLGAVEILNNAQRVCTNWLRVCKDPAMWRVIHMTNNGRKKEKKLDSIYRRAIDLSQGQLTDINIQYFGNKDLLFYLTYRSPHLRRLSMSPCFGIKGKYLVDMIVKFPMLQELHLSGMRTLVSAGKVEDIGCLCPTLRSFTYDHNVYGNHILSDGLAFAVANSMPNLLHLRLFGNNLTNKGLEAILDACPLLESLDLRKCNNIVLEGDMGKRCSQMIRNLKRPSDAVINEWVYCPGSEFDDWEEGVDNWDYREYLQHDRDVYCFSDAATSDYDFDYAGPDMDYYFESDLD